MKTTRRTEPAITADDLLPADCAALANHYRRHGSAYQVQQADAAFDAVTAGDHSIPVVAWAAERVTQLRAQGTL